MQYVPGSQVTVAHALSTHTPVEVQVCPAAQLDAVQRVTHEPPTHAVQSSHVMPVHGSTQRPPVHI